MTGGRTRKRKKFGAMLLVAATMLLLSACEIGQGRECIGFQPTYLTAQDRLDPATARTILSNNEYGRLHCGWRPVR